MKLVKSKSTNGKAKSAKKVNGKRSGRPTFFRGKSSKADHPLYKNFPPPTTILTTREARTILDDNVKRLTKEYVQASKNKKARISRNVVIETLLRKYAPTLTLEQIKRADAAAS